MALEGKRSQMVVGLYLFLVFASGVAVGGFSHWLYASKSVSATSGRTSPEEYRRQYVQELTGRLRLNEEQVKQLSAVLDQTSSLYKQVYEKHRPEYRAIQDSQTQMIQSFLNPWQLAEYEQYRIERAERMKKHGKKMPF
jgi:uncharacterized protein HemX